MTNPPNDRSKSDEEEIIREYLECERRLKEAGITESMSTVIAEFVEPVTITVPRADALRILDALELYRTNLEKLSKLWSNPGQCERTIGYLPTLIRKVEEQSRFPEAKS